MPKYKYDDFRKACGRKKGEDVIVWESAQDDAGKLFNLNTKSELMQFIFHQGFDKITYYGSSKHRKMSKIFIDEYEFRTLGKTGYLAFFHVKKWVIKSFHLSKERSTYFANALKKLLEKKGE